MLIVLEPGATDRDSDEIRERIEAAGGRTRVWVHDRRIVIGAPGLDPAKLAELDAYPYVERVLPEPALLASRAFHANTVVRAGDDHACFGGRELAVIAGPCSVESPDMLLETATAVRAAGARLLRGGAWKPRTSPYAFQGLGEQALEWLAEARARTGLPVVTEVMDVRQIEPAHEHADVLQVGARNMQNFTLLTELGRVRRPVLLKRGPSATLRELLLAAEYVLAGGNTDVILCERGIRTFETATRNTLDVGAVAVLKRETHLPVIVDPSHAAGRRDLVTALALAGVAAGADGLIVEVHPRPDQALSDGDQSLEPRAFHELMAAVRAVARAVGRDVPPAAAPGGAAAAGGAPAVAA